MSDDKNLPIDVFDAPPDMREGVGIFVGVILLAIASFVTANNRGWILIAIGAIGLLWGGWVFFKIYLIGLSQIIPGRVVEICIERFKKPGPAGVIPRYRIKMRLEDCLAKKGRQAIFPFSADNYYENIVDAQNDVRMAQAINSVYFQGFIGFFVINRVGARRVSEAWALIVSGVFLFLVGCWVQFS